MGGEGKWECYGHPRVLGIPIPKTLVIWASPVTLTLTQIARVIWEGDAHITGFWEWGCRKRGDAHFIVTAPTPPPPLPSPHPPNFLRGLRTRWPRQYPRESLHVGEWDWNIWRRIHLPVLRYPNSVFVVVVYNYARSRPQRSTLINLR